MQIQTGDIDLAGAAFQYPVATEAGGAGGIARRGNVRVGVLRQALDERFTLVAGGDVATIEQNVPAGLQCLTDGGQFRLTTGKVVFVE